MRVPILAVACAAILFGAVAHAADREAATALARSCAECHGANGISSDPQTPNLAGQQEKYLEKQLWDFRSPHPQDLGLYWRTERGDPVMDHRAAGMGDEAIKELAAYFANLPCGARPPASLPPAPAKAVVCAGCHGEGGISRYALVPNLAGQKVPYLIKGMAAFREASRTKFGRDPTDYRLHPIMDPEAHRLDDGEIEGLARYFAGLGCG